MQKELVSETINVLVNAVIDIGNVETELTTPDSADFKVCCKKLGQVELDLVAIKNKLVDAVKQMD